MSFPQSVAAGKDFSIAVNASGYVFEWGRLPGRGGAAIFKPQLIPASKFNFEQIRSVSSGAWTALALSESGRLYTWGRWEVRCVTIF